ncbi:fibronectin type III domain-containing protein [Aureispira sp. CCB-E]|uniref:fibronectin type III domain-containing protein n=1 Tax=Aureispira sp. CCB-E TaxID=3051121 RepID=UPI002868BA77|nr:fibronectin type III domain-containing protein [Aureispira sp. CCB-E]WMX12758.1 fibronectin type III domain-containing protein [Aureispira sp. CCB-E]
MKKNLIYFLSFYLIMLSATTTSAQYCTTNVGPSSAGDSSVDSIGLTGDAGTTITYQKVCAATRVEDLTATQSASVTAGSSYNLTVVFGTCGSTPYAGAGEVWIDWNQNDAFDPAESIGTWTGSPTDTSVFSFTVPNSAFNGTTRMRVMQQEGSSVTPPLNPCGSYLWGSVADFSIVISGGVTITCPVPSALTANNLTATSADLGWTENGTATNWQISYGAPGTAAGAGVTMMTTTNPTNVTGLNPNSPYDFYVRSVCGAGDSSLWVGPFNFVTPCAALTAPYSQPFATNALPACWTQMGATNWEYGSNVTNPTGFADYGADNVPDHSLGGGGTFIGMDGSDNTNGEVSTLMSPMVDIAPLTNAQLSYWVFSNNVTDAAQNKLIVEFYDGANWTVVDSIQANLGTTWVEFTTDLTTFTVTGNVQVRFTVTGDNSAGGFTYHNDILIDDVAFRNAPTCLIPASLTANNITATSADLGWTENGTATNWQISYGAPGSGAGAGVTMMTNTNPVNVTGLNSNSPYDFYVRSICGAGDTSMWVGPFNFVTPCGVFTPAYSTDFSTFLPACWEEVDGGSPNTGLGTTGSGAWNQSGSSARVNLYSDFTFDWLLSPEFDLSTGNWELVINANATDYSPTTAFNGMGSDDTVQVVISTDGGTTWTSLYTWNAANPFTFSPNDVIIDLSSYTGTSNLFGIWASEGATNDPEDYYAIINNFELRMPPTCPAPSLLTANNITATSADLGWTENGSATNWQISYGAPGTAAGAGVTMMTTTNPTNITGLNSDSPYDFYVRSVCGAGDSSLWVGPFNFRTPCAVLTGDVSSDAISIGSLPYSTTGNTDSCYMNTSNNASADVWYQYVVEPCTDSLTISLCGSSFDTYLRVFASDASTQIFFNDDNSAACGTGGNSHLAIDVTNSSSINPGDTIYIMVEGYTSNQGVYNLNVSNTVMCPPTNLVITEIMYNPPESGTDSLEFVEIYNNGTTAANLGGYTLSGIAYTFPNVSLPAGGYYVVGVNASAFNTVYGMPADGIASSGGLSNGGEAVIIRNPIGMVVDSVRYDDSAPWPAGSGAGMPDGGGASLILCDTAADNADAANWNACITSTGVTINGNVVLASPGAANSCPMPLDVAVASFYNLDSIYCNAGTISGSVIITNMSNTDATNVPYTITANGTPLGGGTISLLAGFASDTITVGPFPAATGAANIVAMTSLTGDANTSNDMLSMMVYVSNTAAAANIVTDITCNGDSTGVVAAMGSNGIGAYGYMWNSDANLTTDTLMNLPAGMHTVVVMDSVGCTDTAMVTLTEPTAIMLTDTVDNVLCNGDSTGMAIVMATGGTPAYSFAWSNGATSDTIMNLPAGTYTVTVTDANGCMEMLTATVSEATAIMLTDTVDNVLCNGDSTGMAIVMATGGTPAYAFAWSNGAASDTIMNLPAGAYTVTVTDANGCMEMLTATVSEPTALDVTITDNGDGSAYATATGGTPGYTFLWDAAANNQTTDTATALIHNGTYVVTVTDANGCTDTASIVVNINSLTNIANVANLSLFPNPTNANVFVELELVKNTDVQINVTNAIGQLVINKELTNVQSEKVELNTSILSSGVYMVQFTIGTESITRKLIVSKQ